MEIRDITGIVADIATTIMAVIGTYMFLKERKEEKETQRNQQNKESAKSKRRKRKKK